MVGRSLLARWPGFPLQQERCHGRSILHAHIFKFCVALRIQNTSRTIQHHKRRHSFAERDTVFAGEVEIRVILPDVYIDQHIVCTEQRSIARVMEVEIEQVAIDAPVAAKHQQDILMLCGGLKDRLANVFSRIGRCRIKLRLHLEMRMSMQRLAVERPGWIGGSSQDERANCR